MASYVWDPDRVFQLTDPVRGSIICIGRAARRFNARCTWDIPEPECSKISSLLRSMAREPPTMVSVDELKKLAKWSLCKQAHRDQQSAAFVELKYRLRAARSDYMQFRTLEHQNTELEDQIELLDEKYKEVSNTFKASQNETVDRTTEVESLRKYGLRLCDLLSSSTAEVDTQKERALTLSNQLSSSKSELENQKDRALTLSNQLSSSKAELENQRKRVRTLSELLSASTAEFDNQKKRVLTLSNQLSSSMAELENQKKRALTLSDRLSSSTVELEEANLRIVAYKSTVAGLEESNLSLQSQLAKLNEESDEQNRTINLVREENCAVKDQHQTTISELGIARLHSDRTSAKLLALEQRNSNLQSQLNEAIARADLATASLLQNRLRSLVGPFWLSLIRVCNGVSRYLVIPLATLKGWWRKWRLLQQHDPRMTGRLLQAEEEGVPSSYEAID